MDGCNLYLIMSSILVVLAHDEPDERLLEAAKTYATGTDTETFICRFIDRKDYQDEVQRENNPGEQVDSIEMKEREANEKATEIGELYFDGEIPYTAHGLVGTIPDDILRFAEEQNCEQIFVTGKKRSPSGKALFGDVAQSLILNFDGPVTVTTE